MTTALQIFITTFLSFVLPQFAFATPLVVEDFEGIPTGDLIGRYDVGFNATGKALYDKGWTVAGGCPGYYCPGAIVSIIGHDGQPTQALRLRYEEGPLSDSDGTGLEVKVAKECAFGAKYCFGEQQEIWERYYFMTKPVPADTPACAPNCPTVSTVNNSATKQHYFKSLNTSQGASFVTNFMNGFKNMIFSQQIAVDCPIINGVLDCPGIGGSIAQKDNQWYCIETHIKINDIGKSNGLLEIYVDGKLSAYSDNRTIQDASRRAAIDYVMIYRQSGGYQWRYEDDYALSTTQIGCSPTSTSTPVPVPASPRNLNVF